MTSKMKTKQFRWLLTTLMLVAAMLMPIGASAAGLLKPSGDGSSSNPYQISTAAHLYWFAGLVNGTLPGGTDPYPVGSAYKLIPTALKKEDNTYWATFSDPDLEVTLSVPSGRTLNVYNATVSGGTLTLSKRNDCQVAVEEGVLLKTDGEYVNVKENEDNTLTPVDYAHNNLVATPSYAETITDDAGYTLYRLTYNNVRTQDKLGFYLSLVKDENGKVDETSLGKKLKAAK